MFLKFGEKEAWVTLSQNNIDVECNGKLTVKEFLSHKLMNSSLTKDELSQQIDNLETEISKLKAMKDNQSLRLIVLGYKDNEAKITIRENCSFPF